MFGRRRRLADYTRVALGVIRVVNGSASLVVPAVAARGLGVEPEENKTALYVSRLFGVRTVVIGLDLILPGKARGPAVRIAPLIHASDTAAAILAGVGGQLPRGAARRTAVISGVNTVLALVARNR